MANGERIPLLIDQNDDFTETHTRSSNHREQNVTNSFNASFEPSDHIVSVFVVAFDTKAGNVIEWSAPDSVNLEGVEFKAMPSGSHNLQKDFVFFRVDQFYGLSCFEKMSVASDLERGARMKSVGILACSYTMLYRHMSFLENQVRHQLEQPGNYESLTTFWNEKKATLPPCATQFDTVASLSRGDALLEMKITHPAGCFSQFINFFGEHIFVLWKFALLGKRMIFFSPPPIGIICYRVYCACSLAHHRLQYQLECRDVQPHFYINVADIPTLESELSYIACTTEKIFESKTQLYDVYIDNQNILTSSTALKSILKTSQADKQRLQNLNYARSEYTRAGATAGDGDFDAEKAITMFFTEMNERLLQTLLEVSSSPSRVFSEDKIKELGLDPQADRTFLMELVEYHGCDVIISVENPCCPR